MGEAVEIIWISMIGRHGQKYLLTEVTTSINLIPGFDWNLTEKKISTL